MCIDRPDHISRGKGPACPKDLRNHDVLFVGRGWLEACHWLEDHGGLDLPAGATDEEKAAAAQCTIVDFANYYEHMWVGNWLMVFGHP